MKRVTHVALFVWCIVMSEVSRAGFDEGLPSNIKGTYAIALKEWKPLSEQGNAGAQNSLGVVYEKGYWLEQNYAEAVKLHPRLRSRVM